jgi:hypothetical protein
VRDSLLSQSGLVGTVAGTIIADPGSTFCCTEPRERKSSTFGSRDRNDAYGMPESPGADGSRYRCDGEPCAGLGWTLQSWRLEISASSTNCTSPGAAAVAREAMAVACVGQPSAAGIPIARSVEQKLRGVNVRYRWPAHENRRPYRPSVAVARVRAAPWFTRSADSRPRFLPAVAEARHRPGRSSKAQIGWKLACQVHTQWEL